MESHSLRNNSNSGSLKTSQSISKLQKKSEKTSSVQPLRNMTLVKLRKGIAENKKIPFQKCSVPECESKSSDEGLFFHRFPLDESSCEKWLKLIKFTRKSYSSKPLVCSKHFKEEDYLPRRIGDRKILKKNVIPSQYLNSQNEQKFVPKLLKRNNSVGKGTNSKRQVLKNTTVTSKNLPSQTSTKLLVSNKLNNEIVELSNKTSKAEASIRIQLPISQKNVEISKESLINHKPVVIANQDALRNIPGVIKISGNMIILKRKNSGIVVENIQNPKKRKSENSVSTKNILLKPEPIGNVLKIKSDQSITIMKKNNTASEDLGLDKGKTTIEKGNGTSNKTRKSIAPNFGDSRAILKNGASAVTLCCDCNKFCKIDDDIRGTKKNIETLATETLLELQEVNLSNENERTIITKKGIEICDKAIKKENIHLMNLLTTDDELVAFTGINFVILDKLTKLVSEFAGGDLANNSNSIRNRIAMCLCKLRINLSFRSLAMLFGITQQICATDIFVMIRTLSKLLIKVIYWPKMEELMKDIPECFQSFKQTRLILSCHETQIEKQRCLDCSAKVNSKKNGYESVKLLLGVAPSGLIIYKSNVYDCQAVNNSIFTQTNILEQLDPAREAIMADKSLNIEIECIRRNITLIKLPKVGKSKVFSNHDLQLVKNISAARIHVDRTLHRFKTYKILQNKITWRIVPYIDDICSIVAGIVNMKNPIPPDETQLKL